MESMSEFSLAESMVRTTNLQCPVCNEKFKNAVLKNAHQKSKHHFQCTVCKATFPDDRALVLHVITEHKTDHQIRCPGCQNEFHRAGAWMHHIEKRECTRIFPEHLEARQKKHEEFTKALALLDSSQINFEDDIDLSTITTDTWRNHPFVDTADGHDNLKPHQGTTVEQDYKNPEDFPRLPTQEYRVGGSKQPDFLTGDAPGPKPLQPVAAWNRFSKSQGSRSPTQTARSATTQPALSIGSNPTTYRPGHPLVQDKNTKVQVVNSFNASPATAGSPSATAQARPSPGEPITDPDHHDFNASVFYNSILGQFKCPHRCNKKFKNSFGLIAHLKSPAHKGEKIACPSCQNKFNSKAALVSHMETAVTRCGIRNSTNFRSTLARLTGGILDIEPASPLEDQDNPEQMTRSMGRIILDKKAIAELQLSPPERVPGSELKKEEDFQQGGQRKRADYNRW